MRYSSFLALPEEKQLLATLEIPVCSKETLKGLHLCSSGVMQRNPKGVVPVHFLCVAQKP